MNWRLEPLILPFLLATLLLLALPKPGHPAPAASMFPKQTVPQPTEKTHV